MRTYKQIFYITLAIAILSLVFIFVLCDGNKASRIFTGLFTGSMLGCITALINYISARNQIFNNLYDTMANLFVDLHGTRDLLEKVAKGITTDEVDHKTLKTFDPNISGASQLISKATVEVTKIDVLNYTPFLLRSKILAVLLNIFQHCNHRILILNSELLHTNKTYLFWLQGFMPVVVIDSFGPAPTDAEKEVNEKAELKRQLALTKRREDFTSKLNLCLQMTNETISVLSELMHQLDNQRTKSNRKWTVIGKAFAPNQSE